MGRHEDEIGARMLALNPLQELQAGATRHGQVAEDQIRRLPLEGAKGLFGVLAALDVGLTLEHLPGELPVKATVVDDDDASTVSRLGHPIPPLDRRPASRRPSDNGIGGPIFRLEKPSRTAAV
jgi:hypothetical protein